MAKRPGGSEPGSAPDPSIPRRSSRLPPVSTLGEWRQAARTLLQQAGIESGGREADWIVAHVVNLGAHQLTLHRNRELGASEKRRLSRLLHRRLRRVPLQYVLGDVDFFGLSLRVNPSVLIPRPETEGLVERVLEFLPRGEPATVLDVGTGSGAIALALAAERPGLVIWATDVSPPAIRVARANARRLGLRSRVVFRVGGLTGPFDKETPPHPLQVVVSNPPYVATTDRGRLAPEIVDHEPHPALFAGRSGLSVIEPLVPRAAQLLVPGGLLALEIGEDQGETVRTLLKRSRGWRSICIERDLAGRVRYALARKRD